MQRQYLDYVVAWEDVVGLREVLPACPVAECLFSLIEHCCRISQMKVHLHIL